MTTRQEFNELITECLENKQITDSLANILRKVGESVYLE